MNADTPKSSLLTLKLAATVCAGALVAMLSGCAAPKIHTEHDSAANFAAYKTFAVLPFAASGAGTDPGAALRLATPAGQAVRDSLAAKGLSEAARDQADCAVSVRGESLPRVEVTGMGYTTYPVGVRRRGWVYYGGVHAVGVETTLDRKLIVEVFDNATHKLAWVGWTEHSGDGTVKAEKLSEEIRRILAGFPPAPQSP